MLGARLTSAGKLPCAGVSSERRSSGVEHNLAKVGVEGSILFARSISCRTECSTEAPPLH